MVYRIDLQHFLTHAIDYFSYDDLMGFQYCIISSVVKSQARISNMAKINMLYPNSDDIIQYYDDQNIDLFRKRYKHMLVGDKDDRINSLLPLLYNTFVQPTLNHHSVLIVCDQSENYYIDVLCDVLNDQFAIEVANLNDLFTKGRLGSVYIDRDEIHDRAVDMRRMSATISYREKALTVDGRASLLESMKPAAMKQKLKELGINVNKSDKKHLKEMLMESWVNDED